MDETTTYPRDIKQLRLLELHYFRVPRERWALSLVRARQMGADSISTVVPWSWHEPGENVYDLSGISHPARDLVAFMDTCQAMGLGVILDLSPRAGAGLLGGGVPGWLLGEHPEIHALGPDTSPRHDPATGGGLPSAEHPTYLRYVAGWYGELSNTLMGLAWPDGPVVAARLGPATGGDAEPPGEGIPFHWDYNPHVVEVQWPVWLRQQYDGVEALNAAWGTDYHSVSEAEYPRQIEAAGPSPQLSDAARFVAYAAAHALETYTRLLRQAGWTGAIITPADEAPAPLETPTGTRLRHAVQVDPEPPQLGARLRWAMDAPVRADGSPTRGFWAVKAALLDAPEGVKPIPGGVLVTGPQSRRVHVPRPAGDYAVYRLLLDGRMLPATSRRRGEGLYLDYVAADELGATDMYVILDEAAAPLPGFLNEYLSWGLVGRSIALRGAGHMCQTLAETLSESTPAPGEEKAPPAGPASQGVQAAEQSLVEAQRAARRAAVSVARLERLAGELRGDLAPAAAWLPAAAAFSPQELTRLAHLREACTQVAPRLLEAAQRLSASVQGGEPRGAGLTLPAYQAALEEAEATASQAEAVLAGVLARLRADLVSGALPPVAWAVQDWLARTLQSLATRA